MRTLRPVLRLAVLVLTGPLACADGASDANTVIRTDSAGVEIVQTTAPLWPEGEGWQIDPEPVLSIGEVEGDPAYLFGDLTGAIRIGNRIVAADAQTLDLRYYDLTGEHLLTAGGPGEGPGELGSLLQFERCEGEMAYAFDVYDLTLHVRDRDGALVREIRTLEPGADRPTRPYTLVCSTAGTGFAAAGWGTPDISEYVPGTVPQHVAPVWLLDGDAQLTLELGEHLSSERLVAVNRATGQPAGSGPHPFGRSTSFALGAEHVFLGSGASFSVDVHARDGRLVRILRGPPEDFTISPGLIAEYRSAALDEHDERTRSTMADQDFPMPDGFPAYTEMRLDPDGALWVKRWAPPWEVANRWGVFAPDGAFLGHVELPVGMTVTDVGSDWVLGVSTDELGIDRVRMYDLDK